MEVVAEAKDVTKRFGEITALADVNVRINRGELVGLLGPNGAGKSTLIKIMLGLMSRTKGSVILNGYDPYYDARARRGVGVVFERPALPDSLPIKTLLYHAAQIYGSSREEIKRAVKYTGMEAHLDKTFSELSAGLKQRAAIAHALLSRPSLIVADEPTSNLDPIERVRLLDIISTLNADEGITFLLSSHIIPEISRVAKRVVVLNKGRVIMEGNVDEVIMKASIARVRVSDPEGLIKRLEAAGFDARQEGINVMVRLKSPERQAELLAMLSDLSASGIKVLSVDFAGAGLEEILRGG